MFSFIQATLFCINELCPSMQTVIPHENTANFLMVVSCSVFCCFRVDT